MSALPKLLLVEGKEDREVFRHLCNTWRIDNKNIFDIELPCSPGVEGLLADLSVRTRVGLSTLGMVVDADLDPAHRWEQLRAALLQVGYVELPSGLPGDGLVHVGHGTLPRLGVWQMPDNQSPGMLEDFLASLVAEGDPLFPRACQAVAGIPMEHRRFVEAHRAKAEIHTWLAWQREPGTPVGLAITRRYLDHHREWGARLASWLMRVFEVPEPPKQETR